MALSWLSIIGLAIIFLLLAALVYTTLILPLAFRRRYAVQGVPSVKFRWLVGQTFEIRSAAQADDPFRLSRKNASLLGQVFVSYFGPFTRLVINRPSLIQDVLVRKAQHYRKPEIVSQMLGPLLGNGVLLSEGDLWKRQRSLLNPAFHFVQLKQMTSLMMKSSVEACEKWQKNHLSTNTKQSNSNTSNGASSHVGKDSHLPSSTTLPSSSSDGSFELEAHHAFSALTLDIIASTAFGSSFRNDPRVADTIYDSMTSILLTTQRRNLTLVGVLPGLKQLPLPSKRQLNAKINELKQTLLSLLTERRKGASHSLCEGKDLLDLLLDAHDSDGNPMSEDLIKDELMTFVLAGHETTANLMSFMAYLLAAHPTELARMVAEVDSVTNGDAVTFDMLRNLHFCDAVIDESLRIYPPVALVSKEALDDHTIGPDDAPLHICKGDVININVWAVHHDETIWPSPYEFQPDRFLDGSKRHPMAWLPFSGGPRACLGTQFARLEAKMILATILQRFTFELVPGQKIVESVAITMRPKYGLVLRFIPRRK